MSIFYKAYAALLFLFFIAVIASSAQHSTAYLIKGIIADSATKKVIEFATIGIIDQEKKVVELT